MKRYFIVLLVYFVCVSAGSAWALFESNKELVNSAKITMTEAIDAAVQSVPGKAVEAVIDQEYKHTVFEVEIIDTMGKTVEVYVDAQTGDIRNIENE